MRHHETYSFVNRFEMFLEAHLKWLQSRDVSGSAWVGFDQTHDSTNQT